MCTEHIKGTNSALREVTITSVIRQGLFFLNKRVFESCGEYGRSKFTELRLSKKNFKSVSLAHEYNQHDVFGEGSDYVIGVQQISV